MDDFMLAHKIFPDDELIGKITDVLQLSQHGLLYDSNQLGPQILGRLARSKVCHFNILYWTAVADHEGVKRVCSNSPTHPHF